ncbi:hypothetical protein BJV74DRAFT_55786 [Russula compacta]|nr:hypothetical protein BJV74DRAFT_55786 [Russula compacta]
MLFSRLSSSLSRSTHPNKAIIDLLTRCLKEEHSSPTRNSYKIRSFQLAIAAIHGHNSPIRSGKEAITLRGIGLGIANRIDFFLQGKEYDEGLNEEARARLLAIETFQKIPGIGERTATNLVNAGAASVSDLRLPQYKGLLKPTQKIGVLYGEHMTRPIPRSEAEEIAAFIRDHISCNFEIHLTGAYRRESAELPAVSILLLHPQHIHVPTPPPPPPPLPSTTAAGKAPVRTRGRQHVPFLEDVVRPLQTAGLLAATLASGSRQWRGVALLPLRADPDANADDDTPVRAWQEVGDRMRDIRAVRGRYVRLELSLAPLKSRGAAQIALTGDEEFMRIARLAAARHGMYLDEYGLWRWHTSEEAALERESQSQSEFEVEVEFEFDPDDVPPPNWPGTPVGYWELVEGESEDRILEELELGSIAPQRRNFRFLASKKRVSARAGTLSTSALAVGVGAGEDESQGPRRRKNGSATRHQDVDGDILGGA